MKKTYETPTVEMIAFRYRDQVVAASAGDPIPENPVDTPRVNGQSSTMCDISEGFERVLNFLIGDCDWV